MAQGDNRHTDDFYRVPCALYLHHFGASLVILDRVQILFRPALNLFIGHSPTTTVSYSVGQ
jgi:hypothetical protein